MSDIMRIDICEDRATVTFLAKKLKFDLNLLNEVDFVIHKLYKENVFRIALDLHNITFVTSLVLGKLISYQRDLSEKGGGLSIVNACESIIDVLSITRIDKIISVS